MAKNEATLAQTKTLMDPELMQPLLTVQKSYLDASFAEVKKSFGTFDKYLAKGIGVDAAAKAKLQQELLAGEEMQRSRARRAGRRSGIDR